MGHFQCLEYNIFASKPLGIIMSFRKTAGKFLVHPVFISFIVTILIVLLFVPTPGKYALRIENEELIDQSASILYSDLDGNGHSDKIEAQSFAHESNTASLLIRCNPNISFNEWDFKGSFSFADRKFIKTGDYDNNGKKEVYFFTVQGDSIFLNIIKDPIPKSPTSSSYFVSKFKLWNNKPNLYLRVEELVDVDKDSYKELIFTINSGFSADPRQVYIYNIKNNSFKISEKIGYFGRPTEIKDLNGDGFYEFVLNGYAIQNVADTIATPIHDKCCWLIVYDHNLKYLFPPRRMPDFGYSGLTTFAIGTKPGMYELFGYYLPPVSSKNGMSLIHFNSDGTIKKSISFAGIQYGSSRFCFPFKKGNLTLFAAKISDKELDCYDTSLTLREKINIEQGTFNSPDTIDIDTDGSKEIVSIDPSHELFTVYRSDLSFPVTIKPPKGKWYGSQINVIEVAGNHSEFSIFNGDYELRISYKFNPFYYTRWLIYLAIFLAIYLFILLIRYIQRAQILKHQKTEKKITELQMKVVRNQMDPHFTMNAVNSVIAAINDNEKEQATQHLIHFSKMYRHMVLTADKIKCTLGEELDFTRNYLTMEQFRFKDKFIFEFSIQQGLDLGIEVPKMVIQSPVENAVKHGLMNREGKGNLRISAVTSDHHLIIEISDNGIGRAKASELGKYSTGKGMKAMVEFLKLYGKVTGLKAETEIEDLKDEEGNPSGTKVTVKIQFTRMAGNP